MKFSILAFTFCWCFVFVTTSAYGAVAAKYGPNPTNTELYDEVKSHEWSVVSDFIHPNERTPEYLPAVVEDLSEGAYLTVGTERGFMTAAMLPKITRVYFTDLNPEVVLYNRINIALLKISKNHADYVRLRTKAGVVEVATRLLLATGQFTPRQVSWFLYVLRKREWEPDPLKLKSAKISADANYVTNSKLGERLMKLAKADRLSAHRVNLGDSHAVEQFQNEVSRDEAITLVDISNAWWPSYLGSRRTKNFLKPMSQKNPDALVITTSKSEDGRTWFYMTFPSVLTQNQKIWHDVERSFSGVYGILSDHRGRAPIEKLTLHPSLRVSLNAYRNRCEALFRTIEAR